VPASVHEGGTRSFSFRTSNSTMVYLRICRGAEALTSSIPSAVPKEGGGSRIFW